MNNKIKREEKADREVNDIIEIALMGGDNKISKEITYAQAASIRIRSKQIKKEIRDLAFTEARIKEKQIEKCWNRKYGRQ